MHLLPGVDDGPVDMHDSLEMARAAVSSGTSTIVSTPHLRSDFPDVDVHELTGRCDRIRDALAHEAIPLSVVCGGEVALVWALEASPDALRLASIGQRGTDLLVETPSQFPARLDQLLFQLRLEGYRIILAHPERSPEFHRKPAQLEELTGQGILLQVNAEAVLGRSGAGVGRFARRLCTDGLAHVVASDGHRGSGWRPVTALSEAADALAELVGPERAQWMASTAPRAIADGTGLQEAPPVVAKQARRLFRRR